MVLKFVPINFDLINLIGSPSKIRDTIQNTILIV